MTFPEIADTPLIVNANVPLSGVNRTLKSVAENFEFAMHGFNELDSRSFVADVKGDKATRAVNKYVKGAIMNERCILNDRKVERWGRSGGPEVAGRYALNVLREYGQDNCDKPARSSRSTATMEEASVSVCMSVDEQ